MEENESQGILQVMANEERIFHAHTFFFLEISMWCTGVMIGGHDCQSLEMESKEW